MATEEMETLAGRVLESGNPFDDEKFRARIQKIVMDRIDVSSPSQVVRVRVPDALIEDIAIALKPHIDNMLSLAGSIVGTAD